MEISIAESDCLDDAMVTTEHRNIRVESLYHMKMEICLSQHKQSTGVRGGIMVRKWNPVDRLDNENVCTRLLNDLMVSTTNLGRYGKAIFVPCCIANVFMQIIKWVVDWSSIPSMSSQDP
ncbi:hypothetical protein Tco_0217933 [Tanacetum coccineum]